MFFQLPCGLYQKKTIPFYFEIYYKIIGTVKRKIKNIVLTHNAEKLLDLFILCRIRWPKRTLKR